MKNTLLFLLVAFPGGCSSYSAPIVVKNTKYHAIQPSQGLMSSPIVLESSSPGNATHTKQRHEQPDGYSNEYSVNHDDYYADHLSASNVYQEQYYNAARNISKRSRNPIGYIRDISNAHASQNFVRNGSSQNGRYRNDHEDEVDVKYAPRHPGRSVQYVSVMIVSISEAPEQCDYTLSHKKNRYSGSATPSWMDTRGHIGRVTSPQLQSSGSGADEMKCSRGGYIISYVGEHPTTGEQFSGNISSKKAPRSQYLNIPFSL